MKLIDYEINQAGDIMVPVMRDSVVSSVIYRNDEIEISFARDNHRCGLLFIGVVRVKITGFGISPSALEATISGRRVGVNVESRLLNALLPDPTPGCLVELRDEYGDSYLNCVKMLDSGEAILFATESGGGLEEITIACREIKAINYEE